MPVKSSSWQVYLLRCRDGSLYTGITTDMARRLKAHNSGRGAAYLRQRGPGELVYLEDAESRSQALKREAAIKRWPRSRKLTLLEGETNLLLQPVKVVR
jgi:putative endonuclease